MSGTVGYSLKGLDVEITRALRGLNQDAVVGARVAQGGWEFLEAREEEKREIVEAWHEIIVPILDREGGNGKGKGKGKADINEQGR